MCSWDRGGGGLGHKLGRRAGSKEKRSGATDFTNPLRGSSECVIDSDMAHSRKSARILLRKA